LHHPLKTRYLSVALCTGDAVRVPVWILDSGVPGPALLLVAAQHGNEVQGSEVIRRFIEKAAKRSLRGKILAVPFANPTALRQRRPHLNMGPEQPYADDRGHNMNLTWPGNPKGNDTARVTYAIDQAFGEEATHVFDLHCWSVQMAPMVLIDDEPEYRDLARKLGHRFVHVRSLGTVTLAGVLHHRGKIGITYEHAGQYEVNELEVLRCLRLVTNYAKAIGLLRGRLEPGDEPVLFSDETDAVTVKSPTSGLFVPAGCRLCDAVMKGYRLGHVLSDVNLRTTEVASPVRGYLRQYGAFRNNADVALTGRHPYVEKGDPLAIIVCPESDGFSARRGCKGGKSQTRPA